MPKIVSFQANFEKMPRTMTRSEWKTLHRFLRCAANRVNEDLDEGQIKNALRNAIVYGQGYYELE